MKNLQQMLLQQQGGFSGVTHVLIAVFLFLLMFLIPLDLTKGYMESITSSVIFVVLIFFIICGGALLPDLDNMKSNGGSSAGWQLGILGSIMSTAMVSISGVVWAVLHTGSDSKPNTQHRMLWHTPLVALVIILLFAFGMSNGSETLVEVVQNHQWSQVSFPAAAMVLVGMCVYCGANMVFYRLLKMLGQGNKVQFLCLLLTLLSLVLCATMPAYQLKLCGVAVGLGYLFHILGDALTKGGAPLLFPIPTPHGGHWYLWWSWKPLGPLSVETGGVVNSILNIVFLVADAALLAALLGVISL